MGKLAALEARLKKGFMGEKPYWAGHFYEIKTGWSTCTEHWTCGRRTFWAPAHNCEHCQKAVQINESKGLMAPPVGWGKERVVKDTNVAPEGGKKYSFVGRPDFARIIRENEGADVIIVSREDRLVTFMFRVGNISGPNTLDTACDSARAWFEWATYHDGSAQSLPEGWVYFSTDDETDIKNLRKVAQLFVRARTGKHTVEVLP